MIIDFVSHKVNNPKLVLYQFLALRCRFFKIRPNRESRVKLPHDRVTVTVRTPASKVIA